MRSRLLVARIVWVAVALLSMAITVASTPLLFEQYGTLCLRTASSCLERSQLTPEQLRELQQIGISLELHAALMAGVAVFSKLVWMAVGALVFLLRPGDRMALLVSLFLFAFGAATFANEAVEALVTAHSAWWVPARGLQVFGEVVTVLFFLTFPDGRFVPRWTPLFGVLFLAFQIPGDLFPDIYSGSPTLEIAQSLVFMCFLLGMIGSQVYRYRSVSTPDERRQTRWVVFGTTLALSLLLAVVAPLFLFVPGVAQTSPFVSLLIGIVLPLIMVLVPLSVGVAMLRSGLFDIDVVINRALVYGSLTFSLVLLYLGGVVGLQQLLTPLVGESNQLAIVASTLAIAALFSPLRQRIQSFIDKRFYRRKYDAAKTLAAFSARLREETDVDALGDDLVGVVRGTVQPEHASLWLRAEVSQEAKRAD
jgi:hypothetical protein